jgi:hypothetical protein
LARYFQLQAASTSDETLAPSVAITPIAHRTRSKVSNLRKLSRTHLETPTKSTGVLPDDSESEGLDDTVDDSPLVSKSPGPEEIRNLMYQQTKDEQIVNVALVNFLSALTLHSGLLNEWTRHRKSFKAHFTHASFEARTDGYRGQKMEKSGHLSKSRQFLGITKKTDLHAGSRPNGSRDSKSPRSRWMVESSRTVSVIRFHSSDRC